MTPQAPSKFFVAALESERTTRIAMISFVQRLVETLRLYCDELQGVVAPEVLAFTDTPNGAKVEFSGRTLVMCADLSLTRVEFWITAPLQVNADSGGAVKREWTGFIHAPSGFEKFETISSSFQLFRNSIEAKWPYENQIAELLLGRLIMPNWKDSRFD